VPQQQPLDRRAEQRPAEREGERRADQAAAGRQRKAGQKAVGGACRQPHQGGWHRAAQRDQHLHNGEQNRAGDAAAPQVR
jgi:hypothetical protein